MNEETLEAYLNRNVGLKSTKSKNEVFGYLSKSENSYKLNNKTFDHDEYDMIWFADES